MKTQLQTRLRRHAPAALLVTGCLLLSAGTGAVAAGMITGKQIKNGTVTSRDIKNHNLKVKDLASGTRKQLGSSNDAWSTYNDFSTVLIDSAYKQVLTLDLEAGQYMVSAKARVAGTGASPEAQCRLSNGTSTDYSADSPPATNSFGSISTQIVFESDVPRQVYLECFGQNARLHHKKMTAVKVDSITNTAYPNVD